MDGRINGQGGVGTGTNLSPSVAYDRGGGFFGGINIMGGVLVDTLGSQLLPMKTLKICRQEYDGRPHAGVTRTDKAFWGKTMFAGIDICG